MKNTKMKVLTGWIMDLKPRLDHSRGGYATIVIPDLGDRQLTARDTDGPLYIEAGDEEPIFTRDISDRKPLMTDEAVVEVMGIGVDMKIVRWAFSDSWNQAQAAVDAEIQRRQAEIARMPVYRVIRENRFKGQTMSGAKRLTGDSPRNEIVFTGRLDQFVAECPRAGFLVSATDKFAPTYKIGPITALNRFEVKEYGCDWKTCDDPRPFPEGTMYRVMYWQNGASRLLGYGTSLQLNFKLPRGAGDPLAKYAKTGESGGYLYWERESAAHLNLEPDIVWVEVADPRPLPVAYSLPKAETKAKASVAMPKQAKPSQFSNTLHGLDELELVLSKKQ